MLHKLYIQDMCCAVEGNQAVDALKDIAGVNQVTFNTLRREVHVQSDNVEIKELLAALDKVGLKAEVLETDEDESHEQAHSHEHHSEHEHCACGHDHHDHDHHHEHCGCGHKHDHPHEVLEMPDDLTA